MGSADSDVVEFAGVAEGDDFVVTDDVLSRPVEFVGGRGWSDLFRVLRTRRWRRYGFLRELEAARPRVYPPPTTEVWNTDHAAATMGLLNEGFVRANVDALRRLIERERPDVVVDFWNPLAVIAARSHDVPVTTVIQADAHPHSQGFIWWKPMPASVPSPVPAVNRVLADHGLASISSLADLSVGDRTLVVRIPETDPLPDSAHVSYVGALLWQTSHAELPPTVQALNGDRPLVWVYSGNPAYGRRDRTLDSQVVIEASIAALAGAELDVVLATGHHPLPRRMSVMPSNFVHERYVPGLSMARRSDVLVHHGGYGSCQTALWAGRPSVIIPTYSERESNARCMENAGAAVRVPVSMTPEEKHVDVPSLRAAVERALSDGTLSSRANGTGRKTTRSRRRNRRRGPNRGAPLALRRSVRGTAIAIDAWSTAVTENDEIWHQLFAEGNAVLDKGRALLGKIPGGSRCMFCHGPFDGAGGRLMSMIGRAQSSQQPHVCNACVKKGDRHPGGTHVDIATVFADMRGSTPTAERIGDRAFTELINRFYRTSSRVLVDGGALLGRLAGDQAIGYFVPGMAGPEYARAALDSAVELLRATGHTDESGPWIPLGVGVHVGNAYVGLLGEHGGSKELTALGDDINVGARLADKAGVGEVLASLQLAKRIGLDTSDLESRELLLKGKATPFKVAVIRPA